MRSLPDVQDAMNESGNWTLYRDCDSIAVRVIHRGAGEAQQTSEHEPPP